MSWLLLHDLECCLRLQEFVFQLKTNVNEKHFSALNMWPWVCTNAFTFPPNHLAVVIISAADKGQFVCSNVKLAVFYTYYAISC